MCWASSISGCSLRHWPFRSITGCCAPSAPKAAYSSVIVPVIAMSLSTVFEGYRWSLLAGAGAAVTAAGLVIALKARRPNR